MDRRTVVDIDRAIELFEKAANTEPRSALAHSYLAQAHYARGFVTGDRGNIKAASISARTAVELNPQMHETHKALSCALFQQGLFRESLEEAFIAYELADTNTAPLTSEVANNLKILGEPARAAAWYRMAKTSRPGASEFMVADCLADLADDQNAAASYRRVWTLFPEQPEGWMGLCRLALLQKDFATATKISSENWTRYYDSILSKQMAAQVEFFSRDFAGAEKLYQELAGEDSNGGGGFFGAVSYQSALGRLRLAAGDEKTGRRILEDTLAKELDDLRSAPHHPEILYRVAAIESSLGNVDSAFGHLDQAFKEGWVDYRSLDLDPRFDALRSTARYQDIFGSMVTRVASLRAQSHLQK
jgi:tetratricopeptide (TPR) repeat protein